MTVQEFVDNGGRLFHRRENGGRVVTVAYTSSGGTIKYGATIFRPSKGDGCFKRKLHNSTAVTRCLQAPVSISDGDFTNRDRHEMIRSAMYAYGVSSVSPASLRSNGVVG